MSSSSSAPKYSHFTKQDCCKQLKQEMLWQQSNHMKRGEIECVEETSFMTQEMEVKTGLWPNSWKDWWLRHATNAFYQLINRLCVCVCVCVWGGGKDSGSLLTDYADSTSTTHTNTHTHTNMQVMYPAAVALFPWVLSSAALSHPSTLSYTSR